MHILLESIDKVLVIIIDDVEYLVIDADLLEETIMDIAVVDVIFLVIIHYFCEFYVHSVFSADRVTSAHDDLIDVHVHYQVCRLADYVLHQIVDCLEELLLEF